VRWRRGLAWAVLAGLVVAVLWTWWAESHPHEERRLRVLVHDQLGAWFPEQMAPADGWHGLEPRAAGEGSRGVRVVLVHGLDEPGTIWDELVPALQTAGHDVWEFRYPNDQGIDRSALYLASRWPALSVDRPVVLVGHSMGGLVAREFVSRLRHPVGIAPQVAGPAVAGVIVVGTPNRGSEWARLRVWLELRDQFPTYQGRRFSLFAALRDGTGEAKIDLRPDSDFLRDLNDRPWPTEVPILAIAGRLLAAPADLTEGLEAAATAIGSPELERRLSAWWSGIGGELGDGVVSLASAGLPGGPTPVTVDATHRGMLARLFPSDPEPPAIAPILAAIRDWNATTATAQAGAVGDVP